MRPIPTAIGALRLLRLALIGTGIGAAVVLIGTAAALIMRYWEPIAAFFQGFATGIGEAFEPLEPIFNWIGEAFTALAGPVDFASEELEGFRSTGESVGRIVGAVFNGLLWPIRQVIDGVGGVLKWLGLVDGAEVEATVKRLDEEAPSAPSPPRRPVLQTAAAAVVGAGLAATPAAADAPEYSTPAFPQTAATQPVVGAGLAATPAAADAPEYSTPAFPQTAATQPVVGAGLAATPAAADAPEYSTPAFPQTAATQPVVGATAPDDVDPAVVRDQVRRDLAAAGFGQQDEEDLPAMRRIEAGLAQLNAEREQEAVPLAGAPQGFRAAQPGAVQGASLVFHQTFHFEGAGPEVYDEIERRMEAVMRRASVEAGLVEAEDEL